MLCSDEIITNSKHPPPHAYIDLPILQFHLHMSNIIHLISSTYNLLTCTYIDLTIITSLHITNIIHLISSTYHLLTLHIYKAITAESYQSIYHDDCFEMLR